VQDDAQESRVDLEATVMFDETEFLNLFMKKFTRDRVVPIISASISCERERWRANGIAIGIRR
jgi:hypothetical protein